MKGKFIDDLEDMKNSKDGYNFLNKRKEMYKHNVKVDGTY